MALNILDGLNASTEDPMSWHQSIEAIKLAVVDAHQHVTDSNYRRYPLKKLLSPAFAARRRQIDVATKPFFLSLKIQKMEGSVYLLYC